MSKFFSILGKLSHMNAAFFFHESDSCEETEFYCFLKQKPPVIWIPVWVILSWLSIFIWLLIHIILTIFLSFVSPRIRAQYDICSIYDF